MRKIILCFFCLALLAACGFKGPLYLPDSEKGKKRSEHEQKRASAAAAAASAAAATAARNAEAEESARRRAAAASAMESAPLLSPLPDDSAPEIQP